VAGYDSQPIKPREVYKVVAFKIKVDKEGSDGDITIVLIENLVLKQTKDRLSIFKIRENVQQQ
jgi:hypothetical protein